MHPKRNRGDSEWSFYDDEEEGMEEGDLENGGIEKGNLTDVDSADLDREDIMLGKDEESML